MVGSAARRARLACTVLLAGLAACGDPSERVETSERAILDGEDDAGDAAAFALMTEGSFVCGAALVKGRVAVTAAHCASGSSLQARFGERVWTSTVEVPVVDVRAHPDFDAVTLDNDIAVLLLGADPPVNAPPWPLDEGGILQEGLSLRLVGYGITAVGGKDVGDKHTGPAVVATAGPTRFTMAGAPSRACDGDSGSPVLADIEGEERLVGVVSGGDVGCASARATRVDAFAAAFVAPYIAEVSAPAKLGDRCFGPDSCVEGACRTLAEDAFSMCSRGCATSGDCAGLVCEDGMCVPDGPLPGAPGAACREDHDCRGTICGHDDTGEGRCGQRCIPDVLTCDDDSRCVPDVGHARSFCEPIPPEGGACASSGGAAGRRSGWLAGLLAMLALVAIRRRRAPG